MHLHTLPGINCFRNSHQGRFAKKVTFALWTGKGRFSIHEKIWGRAFQQKEWVRRFQMLEEATEGPLRLQWNEQIGHKVREQGRC
jgi:hypothetical protein